jgi:hypothetical protein
MNSTFVRAPVEVAPAVSNSSAFPHVQPQEREPAENAETTLVQRAIRQAGGDSPQAPPEQFGALLRQPSSEPSKRAGMLLQLQRHYGNNFVQSLVQRQENPGSGVLPQAGAGETKLPMSLPAGDGVALDPAVRTFMEVRFGRDFGGVRVHTDAGSALMADALQADAFTTGRDIYFATGRYAPQTPAGRRLLAHELAHTVQQSDGHNGQPTPKPAHTLGGPFTLTDPKGSEESEAERVTTQVLETRPLVKNRNRTPHRFVSTSVLRIGRQPTVAAPTSDVAQLVDVIIDALEGYTTASDSETILNQFHGKGPAVVQAIMSELKSRASQHGQSPEGMVDWLLGDITEENRRELRLILINSRVDDITRIVTGEVLDLLEGYTSEANSGEIYGLLMRFSGTSLDGLLSQIEARAGKDPPSMMEWLFGDLDRSNAERIRQHFFANGGPRSIQYAALWTASKIYNLLSGYTGHSDSTDIVWNFRTSPPEYRPMVQVHLDEKTRAQRNQSAEDSLMEDMDQSDYETLSAMQGLTLRPYDRERGTLEAIISGAEWGLIVVEWIVCGVVGILTGLLAVLWDLVLLIKDVFIAVWDIVWMIIYLISGGAAGSENFLRVKEFFTGIGKLFTEPGVIFDQMWEDLKLEFHTIEGPFSDCRRAEFIIRKVVYALANILLIFFAGYGAVKTGASALRAAAELAALAREVGLARAIAQTGGRAARAVRRLVAVTAEQASNLLRQLRRPAQLLKQIRTRLNVILLAAQDQGYWQYLRGRTGGLLENERRFWEENRRFWEARGRAQQQREVGLTDEFNQLDQNLQQNQAPQQADDVIGQVEEDVNRLNQENAELHREVVGEAPPEGAARPPEQVRYDTVGRTDEELLLDRDPTPRPAETADDAAARVRAADQEIELRQMLARYNVLGDRPPHLDISINDRIHADAHTLRRHGSDIPLERRLDANGVPDGTRTIEGRIHNDPPWNVDGGAQNFSARWTNDEIMNQTVNRYLLDNWETIRSNIAMNGVHEETFNAGRLIGEGFFNQNYGLGGPPISARSNTPLVTIRLRLVPGNPPSFFVVSAFPSLRGF